MTKMSKVTSMNKTRSEKGPEGRGDTIDITVRGVDARCYDSFSAIARKSNVPIGRMLSSVLDDFLEEEEKPGMYYVQHMREVRLSKADLKPADKPYVFRQIGVLVFEEGVTWEQFSRCVSKIRNVNRLFVPQSLPRLQVLTRCNAVSEVASTESLGRA